MAGSNVAGGVGSCLSRLSRIVQKPTWSPEVNVFRNAAAVSKYTSAAVHRCYCNASAEKIERRPISKLVIANRGEIACRVIRSARKMGIRTVAVYSDADANAMHVAMADEAYHIGPPQARESYLRMEKIIDVANLSGAQAVHPGYGFLSEKPEFADLCEQENIIFVGPPSSAIRDMGIKSTSKHIMGSAGVPIIQGYHGEEQSVKRLKEEAEKIGYPVMIKAVRGGGGKGMRIVFTPEDFEAELESAKRESLKAFADEVMLVEKFVERPRHVEVQVFADSYGNTVYLYERDCSVQRRHQKIIEEAPAPGISNDVRKQIGEAAVKAAEAVGYVGAGTVEFIMDKNFKFYFMEMNTRLQVEHPVSEMITGLDLVELQLRIARGESLTFSQEDIPLKGHSFEARIYAEDPDSDFLPGSGPLIHLSPPEASDDVRVETGVRQGDDVTVYYDPMIAKLVVWDESRDAALAKLRNKLNDYHIVGLSTNIKFLLDLASHPNFIEGDVHTGFIEEHFDDLFAPKKNLSDENLAQAALALLLLQQESNMTNIRTWKDTTSPFKGTFGYRVNKEHVQRLSLKDGETVRDLEVTYVKDGQVLLQSGTNQLKSRGQLRMDGNRTYLDATINGKSHRSSVVLQPDAVILFTKDGKVEVGRPVPMFITASQAKLGIGRASAPMTGTIVQVLVEPDQEVKSGDVLIVMEAMKMEHKIQAPKDGKIEKILYNPGQTVERNAELVKFYEETNSE